MKNTILLLSFLFSAFAFSQVEIKIEGNYLTLEDTDCSSCKKLFHPAKDVTFEELSNDRIRFKKVSTDTPIYVYDLDKLEMEISDPLYAVSGTDGIFDDIAELASWMQTNTGFNTATGGSVADGSITTLKLADDAVTDDKLSQSLLDQIGVSGNSSVITVTADYNMLTTDKTVLVDASDGPVNVTLPTLANINSLGVLIKKDDTSNNIVTISTPNSETIDGLATRTIATYRQSRFVISDGTDYKQVGGYTPNIENRILIKRVEQFSIPLLAGYQYFIDGDLGDLGTTQIIPPTSGNTFIVGLGYDISKFHSTADNYTMIQSGNSGNITFKDIEMSASGTNSQLFDVDNNVNNGAIEFIDCNIGSFARTTTSFGEIDEYRQVRFDGCGFINYDEGFSLNGVFSGGLAVTNSVVLSAQPGSSLFIEGTAFSMQGSSTSNVNASSGSNSTDAIIWDFQESNISSDGGFTLVGARFGGLTNPVSNLSESSVKAFYKDCVGIQNTRPGYEMLFSTQALTPLTVNTPVKANGTTTTLNSVWWSQTGNNEVTYNSSLTKDFKITVNITVDGGANDEIGVIIMQWDDSISDYVILREKVRNISNIVGGLDVATYSFVSRGEFNQNDRIEVFLENLTDGTDVTVLDSESEIFVEVI